MSNTTVYRVETALGHGPYYYSGPESEEWDIAIADHRAGDDQHPAYRDDCMRIDWQIIFGFASIAAMRAWFNGTERLFLSSCGHRLSAYEVEGRIAKGNKQQAFHRKDAKLLWQKPLNHF